MLNNCYLKAIKAIKLICIKFIISFKSTKELSFFWKGKKFN